MSIGDRLREVRKPGDINQIDYPSREVIPITWFTQQIGSELEQFQRIICDMPIEVVLEIGSAQGGTVALWAMIASKVISVDLEHRAYRKIYKDIPELESRVVLVDGDTHELETLRKVVLALDGKKVDLLFIDGDHTERGAEQDFTMYSTVVKDGGLVAFHDITQLTPNLWYHVSRFYPLAWEIKHRKSDNGIGVIKFDSKVEYMEFR